MQLGDTWGADSANYDAALAAALDSASPGFVSATQEARFPGESALDAALRVAPQLFMADNQRRLLNIQLDRASKGLPPLDSSNYGLGVNVGLAPDTQKLIMYGVGALALVLILPRMMRR